MQRYIFGVKLLCVLLLMSIGMCAQTRRESLAPFDKPSKRVLDLGPSPYYQPSQHMRKKLTCYIYPTFMVKQYDEGQKGAEWLSITRFEQGGRPVCALAHSSREKVIESTEWPGYFKGAKNWFAFFEAPDGTDEGMPFAVYDVRTGRKVFEDSAYLWTGNRVPASSKVFDLRLDRKQRLLLRYLRVVSTSCDLMKDGAACWKQVRAKYGILASERPACSGYEQDYHGKWASAVGYPVFVVLSEHPGVNSANGPIFCWPID